MDKADESPQHRHLTVRASGSSQEENAGVGFRRGVHEYTMTNATEKERIEIVERECMRECRAERLSGDPRAFSAYLERATLGSWNRNISLFTCVTSRSHVHGSVTAVL